MSRKRKRKRNRAANRRSAAAVQQAAKVAASPVQRLLDIADEQPDPHQALSTSATIDAAAAVQHITRKDDTYYLHQGRTKTGKPKYFFSRKSEGELCRQVPDGYEIHENPRGQVFCRRIQPKLISEQEIEVVREAIRSCGKQLWAGVDVKKKDIMVYEREEPCFKFSLCDEEKRSFVASRWCYRGSIDDWIPLCSGPEPLSQLVRKYCRHIGEESFFELI